MWLANFASSRDAGNGLLASVGRIPVWLWAFLAHEGLLVWAYRAPFPKAPHRYLAANQNFYWLGHFWFQWDSLWYTAIGRYGYAHLPGVPPGSGTVFFPWLPVVIHVTGMWGAWGLTQGALALSLWLLERFFRRLPLTLGEASLAVWLFALNPAAIYYSTLYAEPWTVALGLVSIELGSRRRWGLAALAGLLTATTQATGVLVGWFPLIAFGSRVKQGQWKSALGPLAWGGGGFLGIAGYALYLGLRFHHPFWFASREHTVWGAAWNWPWVQWYQAVGDLVVNRHLILLRAAIWAAVTLFVLAGALMLRFLVRRDNETVAASWYGITGLAIALSFTHPAWPLYSTLRIVSVTFPLYAGIARLPRWFVLCVLVGSAWLAFDGARLFTHGWWYQ